MDDYRGCPGRSGWKEPERREGRNGKGRKVSEAEAWTRTLTGIRVLQTKIEAKIDAKIDAKIEATIEATTKGGAIPQGRVCQPK